MTTGELIEILDRYTSDTPITINGNTAINLFESLNEDCVCELVNIQPKQKTARADTQSGQTNQHR